MLQEQNMRDDSNEVQKLDVSFLKENQSFMVAVTVWREYPDTSLEVIVMEKVKKYRHLHKLIQELTNVVGLELMGFPLGERVTIGIMNFWGPWVSADQGKGRQPGHPESSLLL